MAALEILLVSLICLSIFGTFFNSILHRRSAGVAKRLYQARMNINMGVMFISIASLQLTLPGSSALRYFLLFLILVVGLINLYYGVKHRRHYAKLIKNEVEWTQSTQSQPVE